MCLLSLIFFILALFQLVILILQSLNEFFLLCFNSIDFALKAEVDLFLGLNSDFILLSFIVFNHALNGLQICLENFLNVLNLFLLSSGYLNFK